MAGAYPTARRACASLFGISCRRFPRPVRPRNHARLTLAIFVVLQHRGRSGSLEKVGYPRMSFILEFWEFLRVRKKFWLLPILLLTVLFGGLVVLTKGSVVAPFIYTIF